MNYSVSIESLHRNFPTHYKVPRLLLDFASWLANKPAGSLGTFRLQSERFNDHWIENGADLHPYFAFFIRDPTGGQIGYWLYDKERTESVPIVVIGSEGELRILSDTLEEFLMLLADGNTQASDLDSREEGENQTAELTKWLAPRGVKISNQSRRNHPDLGRWMAQWGEQQRDRINKDPFHVQIADKLRKYVKPNAEPWETANFDVLLVGTQFRMWHRSFGPQPMPPGEISGLESLFRSVREQRAKIDPDRGLWFSSWVTIGSQGGANLSCNYLERPQILDERPFIPTSDYDLDLTAFPRSKHWMPEWLESR